MTIFRKGFWFLFFLFAIGLCTFVFFRAEAHTHRAKQELPTYYSYPVEELKGLKSAFLMNEAQFDAWEDLLDNYFEEKKINFTEELRFFAYLYQMQRDAAFLSYNAHQHFLGSLDPITAKCISLFFPDFTDFPSQESDSYSEKLAELVFLKYLDRFEKEKENNRTFSSSCFFKEMPRQITAVANWNLWTEPLPEIPPSIPLNDTQKWEKQIALLKKARSQLTTKQIQIVYRWEGEKGLGEYWHMLVEQFLEQKRVPFGKSLLVRSLVLMGLYDGYIGEMTVKYTYCSPRPAREDSSIHPLIPDPETPGYPSGHATQATIVAEIMSYFFPESAEQWQQLRWEVEQSRLWAGVHFPYDIEGGHDLGKKIASQILDTLIEQQSVQ